MFRDDGANDIDTDVDGDGLQNDEDWDDDNDGINDFFDPDDGNCGVVDIDNTDNFWGNSWPQGDGDAIDGSEDGDAYVAVPNYYWNLTWGFNPSIQTTASCSTTTGTIQQLRRSKWHHS